ncbi:MAG: glutamate--tRNA ligase [Legionellales bacterium]
MTIRTRFAPSPTGFLHLGGARTAFFSWLFAKQIKEGEFILRIEDTDVERSTQESINVILDAMEWLGLDYVGPYYQMQRLSHYHDVVQKLVDNGHAYRCYCTKERLATLREQQIADKQKPRYDGYCREHQPTDPNQPFVVRFKNPTEGVVEFTDLIHGKITVANSELDDLVLLRTDSVPTYNLGVVVDDWEMEITHVIRGDDHINNTPRQINILTALGAPIPQYAHVPMILGSDGQRLSKRHGAVNILQYRDAGYLPEAMLNYLARLGWSHGDQEIFTVPELIEKFNISDVNKAAAGFDPDKLLWVNQQHIKMLSDEELTARLLPYLQALVPDLTKGPAVLAVAKVQRDRYKTLQEMAQASVFWYTDNVEYLTEAANQWFSKENLPVLDAAKVVLTEITDWQAENIHQQLNGVRDMLEIKFPRLAQPLRVAASGSTSSPSIDATLALLGKDKTLHRIEKAIAWINQNIA